ncbi:ETX/MTX2 family pore-forming toxin [Bacillus cereus]|uniref:ETX/MTX2 family pore-forming toxin n=1 Tax=Bacillus cereus TaxID=1396 RepID=UPI003A10F567
MNKKVTKAVLSMAMGISVLASPVAIAARTENNKEQQAIPQINQKENKFPDVGQGIEWLSQFYGKALKNNGEGYSLGKDVMNYFLEVKNSYGELAMEPQVISTTPLWAGQSDLENATDHEQNLNSTEFKKTYSNTTTTSTENGFMIGQETEGKVGIPFVAEGKVTIKTEYNFNHTNGYETSESVEYIAPSQSIKVPAHTIARVTALLDVKKIKGKMNLHSEIGLNKDYGYDMVPLVYKFGGPFKYVTLGTLYDEGYKQAQLDYSNLPDPWNIIPGEIEAVSKSNNPNHLLASGVGIFESEYGSVFNVKVEYINMKTKKVEKTENLTIEPKIAPVK